MTVEIVLIGHAGFWNRGCEAIVRGTVDIIRGEINDARITLVSNTAESDAIEIRNSLIQIDKVVALEDKSSREMLPAWLWNTINRKLRYSNMSADDYRHRDLYRQADIVISIGGDNFSDDYGTPREFFDALDAARHFGAKTVIWGASIGPFKADEALWAEALKKLDLITVRENLSLDYLKSLGVTDNVYRVADPAFVMGSEYARSLSYNPNETIVGIGVSALIRKYFEKPEAYVEFVDFET